MSSYDHDPLDTSVPIEITFFDSPMFAAVVGEGVANDGLDYSACAHKIQDTGYLVSTQPTALQPEQTIVSQTPEVPAPEVLEVAEEPQKRRILQMGLLDLAPPTAPPAPVEYTPNISWVTEARNVESAVKDMLNTHLSFLGRLGFGRRSA